MKRHPLNRKLDRLIARFFIFLGFTVIRFIPKRLLVSFAKTTGKLAYYIAFKHRNITLDNLTLAFGKTKTKAEYKKITQKVFQEIILTGCETIFTFFHKNRQYIKNKVPVDGLENLTLALLEKKGVILLSAHFGNFPLLCTRLSQENFSLKTIIRYPDEKYVQRLLAKMSAKANVQFISARPRNKCVKLSIRHLRQNGVLCLLADQSKNSGVFVEFFGQLSGTAAGPAVMALRTGAPILPAFITRDNKNNHKITIHPALTVSPSGDFNADVLEITQKFTNIIEDYTKLYPEQWWWLHQRWKHKPNRGVAQLG